jgi:hypothetical protein
MRNQTQNPIVLTFLALGLWACSPDSKDQMDSRSPSNVPAEGTEVEYNGNPIPISGPTTEVVAKAQFKRINDTTGNEETLPIQFVEFWILNSNGAVIQRGETDANGDLSALIPKTSGQFTLQIRSRAFNSHYKASVLDTPYDKRVYFLNFLFNTDGIQDRSPASGSHSVTALGDKDSSITAGAFNILHNIYLANQFLKDQTTSQPSIPKVQVYWQKGVTPAIYFGSSGGISFYVPNSNGGLYEGLYILGGINGSVCVDTDHFDNSVIIHEYGHFLEHKLSRGDSPGGSHDGRRIIDPRLAWSEGFANYFQGAVLSRPNYRDTNAIGCASQNLSQILFSLVKTNNLVETTDIPLLPNEGNFREMAIARYLYGITSDHNASPPNGALYKGLNMPFQTFWNSFLSLSNPDFIGRSAHHFSRHFTSTQTDPTAFKASGTPFEQEKQNDTLNNWARPLVPSPVPCPAETNLINNNGYFSFNQGGPKPDKGVTGSDLNCGSTAAIAWSDMFNSNDFYVLNLTYPSSETVWIEYKTSSGTPYDLDLYLYKSNFTFLNTTDILRASERVYPEEPSGGVERIGLAGLPTGRYFLNIKVDQPACIRSTTRYRIRFGNNNITNDQYLCPSSNIQENWGSL